MIKIKIKKKLKEINNNIQKYQKHKNKDKGRKNLKSLKEHLNPSDR